MTAVEERDVLPEYRTYPRRWAILACVMFLNIIGYMLAISMGPIAPQAAEYYGINGDMIDLLILLAMAINIPGLLIGVFAIDRLGLRFGIRYGATFLALGSLVRMLSTFPSYESHLEPNLKFWLTFAGQSVISLGHPFLITICTKTSQVWFSEKERMWTTAALSVAPAIGSMLGSVLAPAIVRQDQQNVPYINIAFTVFSSKTVFAFVLFMGAGLGMFNTLTSQLGQIMCVKGYSSTAAGLTAFILIFCGLFGAFIVGPVGKRLGRQEEMVKLTFALSSLATILMCVLFREEGIFPAIAAATAMFGFFGFGGFPLTLELAVEESYPADPVISEAFIHMSGQFNAIIIILVGNVLHWEPSEYTCSIQTCRRREDCTDTSAGGVYPWDYTPYFYLLMAFSAVVTVGFVAFIRPTLRRAKLDVGE